MRCVVFAVALAFCLAPTAQAQLAENKISCYADRSDNAPYKKKLWDGYEISLGPARHSRGPDDACTAAIYDSGGRVVYRTTGFNVIFDERDTGKDFVGDGKTDVVFETDTGGGMHCCWAYNVFSLWPKPHKLFDVSGLSRFEQDSQGKVVIWERDAGPYGFTSMARQPFAERVLRFRDGNLQDVTVDFCTRLWTDENEDYRIEKQELTPENIQRLQSENAADVASYANEEIVSALLSRALQHVFCREFDQADADLNLWPEATRAKVKAEFAESIKERYREFAKRLLKEANAY